MSTKPHTPIFQKASTRPILLPDHWATPSTTLPGAKQAIIMVTPELADNWLDNNSSNRVLRRNTVKRYSADMWDNSFKFNGAPIVFAMDGRLIDGQHRLNAVIATDVTIESSIVYGLPDSAQLTIDDGVKRSLADALHMGYRTRNANTAASVLSCLFTFFVGHQSYVSDRNANGGFSKSRALRFYEKHMDEIDFVVSMGVAPTLRKMLFPSVTASYYFIFRKANKETADWFFEKLRSGNLLDDSDPVLALRNTLLTNKSNKKCPTGAKTPCALLIKAWNSVLRGTPMRKCSWTLTGPKAEPFPKIINQGELWDMCQKDFDN